MTTTSGKTRFKRDLSPVSVWALAFGCIIGWGAFMMPGTTFLPTAGTLGTTIAMIIGALIMIIIAFSYSYMITIYPKVGGEVTYARECFGPRHAYFCGWFLALAYLANVPMNCTALGLMTRKLFFGVFQFGRLYKIAGYDIWFGEVLLSLVVLGLVSWLSIRGIKKSGLVQSIMAISLGTAFLIITVSALFSPITQWSNLSPYWGPSSDVPGLFSKAAISGILAIVAVAPWAYVGFETIPQAAEEFNFSINKVNVIMILAIIFGCLVYSCNNLVTAAASPEWTEFIKRHDWAVGAAVEALMGKVGLVVLGIAITSAILTGILGFLTATSRLLYSMSRDGYIPAKFSKLHPEYGTPSNAIIFCLVFSACGPWFGRTALGWFVDMAAIGGAIGFGYATWSCFVTIRKRKALGLETCSRAMLQLSALLGMVCSIGFIALLLIPGMPGCLNSKAYVMFALWAAIGVLFFVLHCKRVAVQ